MCAITHRERGATKIRSGCDCRWIFGLRALSKANDSNPHRKQKNVRLALRGWTNQAELNSADTGTHAPSYALAYKHDKQSDILEIECVMSNMCYTYIERV